MILKIFGQCDLEHIMMLLIIKFQNILRNTTQVIIRHRVKILFSVRIKSNNSGTAKVKIFKNERDPPLSTGKLLIKFQNILRNTTQVIIRHRVKILFSIISSPITLERQKWKSYDIGFVYRRTDGGYKNNNVSTFITTVILYLSVIRTIVPLISEWYCQYPLTDWYWKLCQCDVQPIMPLPIKTVTSVLKVYIYW